MEKNLAEPFYSPKVDILIVGAGLAGLVSAYKILEKEGSLQVKILEASNEIGGQIGDTPLGEIGGKWITEGQNHIYQLLRKLKIPAQKRMILGPRLKRCWDIDRGIFSRFAKYELRRYLRELDLKMHFYRPGRFDVRKTAVTMEQHICHRLFFRQSRKFMTNLVQLICGANAADIRYTEFMKICYSSGGLDELIDIYLECPKKLLGFSSRDLLVAISEKLKHTEILYWRKAYEVRNFKDYVEVRDSEFEIHTADAVILAIPWNGIREINFSPSLPYELRKNFAPLQKSRRMVTSFIANYQFAYWRASGYSGNFLCSEPLIVGHEYGPSTYSGLTVHEASHEPVVRRITLETLAKHFGDNMLAPISYYQRTYELSSMVNVPSMTPWKRVVWSSSTAAATCHRGLIGGAVQSGLRAAVHALLLVRPQTVSWQDISEVQPCDRTLKRDASWLSLWQSTWNIYNVTFYSVFIVGVVAVLRYMYRKHS